MFDTRTYKNCTKAAVSMTAESTLLREDFLFAAQRLSLWETIIKAVKSASRCFSCIPVSSSSGNLDTCDLKAPRGGQEPCHHLLRLQCCWQTEGRLPCAAELSRVNCIRILSCLEKHVYHLFCLLPVKMLCRVFSGTKRTSLIAFRKRKINYFYAKTSEIIPTWCMWL